MGKGSSGSKAGFLFAGKCSKTPATVNRGGLPPVFCARAVSSDGALRPAPSAPDVVGASPSGKAVDFDSTMRRFESSRPSHPVRISENFLL